VISPFDEGQPPPWLIPFCASCDMPVEKFTKYPIKVANVVDIEAQCHGATQGIRLTLEEMVKLDAENGKIVMFRRRQGFDSVR
jgi:hypothetical protein